MAIESSCTRAYHTTRRSAELGSGCVCEAATHQTPTSEAYECKRVSYAHMYTNAYVNVLTQSGAPPIFAVGSLLGGPDSRRPIATSPPRMGARIGARIGVALLP